MKLKGTVFYLGKILKCFVPYGFIAYYRFRKKEQNKERRIRCGILHPDKTFYVIRRPSPGAGLFSNYHYVLGHLIYALDRNYIPIVDMEKYKTFFNEKVPVNGTRNAWEYYFKQPSSYTLSDVYRSQNVVLSRCSYLGPSFPDSEAQITYLYCLIAKHLPFNDITKEAIKGATKRLFSEKANILGVKYRGSDYSKSEFAGHAVVASVEDYINRTERYLSEWKMDWIYLSTEEADVVDIFRAKFGTKVIVTESLRIKDYQTYMGESSTIRFNRVNDNYIKGIEYIIDTVLLSYCDTIIGPKVNGTMFAIELNNNKYKNKYIYELGIN